MLVLMTVACTLAAAVRWRIQRFEPQRRAVDAIVAAGGSIEYAGGIPAPEPLPTSGWLSEVVGAGWPPDIVGVRFAGKGIESDGEETWWVGCAPRKRLSEAMREIPSLKGLRRLELKFVPVDEDDLCYLHSLPHLEQLNVVFTNVSPDRVMCIAPLRSLKHLELYGGFGGAEIQRLRQALPDCTIEYR
jgi:hypothetical protein